MSNTVITKRLNLKKTSLAELREKWQMEVPFIKGELYIRCNFKGEINWNIAPVYRAEELVGRNNVYIL